MQFDWRNPYPTVRSPLMARNAVATSQPLAAQAGLRMLLKGGNAIDAAIAAAAALTVVEPISNGLGSDNFAIVWDGKELHGMNSSGVAPAGWSKAYFDQKHGGQIPLRGFDAVTVPGAVAGWAALSERFGALPFADLLEPAIELAEQGFALGPRLHALLVQDTALRDDPVARAYFFDARGQPHPVGHRLRNPELAQVLRQVAAIGPLALVEGPVARAIVEKVRNHPRLPGSLAQEDLRNYQPREREALCHPLRTGGRWVRMCGFPPPSSGGLAVGQILGLLSRTPQAIASTGVRPKPS